MRLAGWLERIIPSGCHLCEGALAASGCVLFMRLYLLRGRGSPVVGIDFIRSADDAPSSDNP
jgi:hypothetical protein